MTPRPTSTNQAAEDAQKELDEAFERARQQNREDVQPDSITALVSGSAPSNQLQVRPAGVPSQDRDAEGC